MKNLLHRVIVIPEKLTSLAAAGLLWLIVKALVWVSTLSGIDFTTINGALLAAALAAFLMAIVKAALEKFVPESWHEYINSFLAWLATVVVANFMLKSLL